MESLLRIIRNIKGYTIKEMAKKIDTEPSNVSRYERHKTIPTDKTIIQMAKLLNVNQDILFFSFGLFPPKIKDLIRTFPIFYMEKINELCDNGMKINGKTEEEINFINNSAVLPYVASIKEDLSKNEA